MKIIFSLFKNLALELPSLRISSPLNCAWLVAMGILSIVLLHTASRNLVYSVNWIGMDIFSELFIFSLVPIKPKRLTNSEREKISLTPDLKEILVGLLLGDLAGTLKLHALQACNLKVQKSMSILYSVFIRD